MNDFREYSAAFHAQNDDVMHYGIKGMKWKHHKLPIGGVIGLGRGLIKLGRNKKESDDKQERRGTYAEAHPRGTYAEAHPNDQKPRGTWAEAHPREKYSHALESENRQKRNSEKIAKQTAFKQAASKGLVEDSGKRAAVEYERASAKREAAKKRDKELDKERKRRQRKYANLRKAEEAYRRGGH